MPNYPDYISGWVSPGTVTQGAVPFTPRPTQAPTPSPAPQTPPATSGWQSVFGPLHVLANYFQNLGAGGRGLTTSALSTLTSALGLSQRPTSPTLQWMSQAATPATTTTTPSPVAARQIAEKYLAGLTPLSEEMKTRFQSLRAVDPTEEARYFWLAKSYLPLGKFTPKDITMPGGKKERVMAYQVGNIGMIRTATETERKAIENHNKAYQNILQLMQAFPNWQTNPRVAARIETLQQYLLPGRTGYIDPSSFYVWENFKGGKDYEATRKQVSVGAGVSYTIPTSDVGAVQQGMSATAEERSALVNRLKQAMSHQQYSNIVRAIVKGERGKDVKVGGETVRTYRVAIPTGQQRQVGYKPGTKQPNYVPVTTQPRELTSKEKAIVEAHNYALGRLSTIMADPEWYKKAEAKAEVDRLRQYILPGVNQIINPRLTAIW